jgi:predicted alpha-1,2-mannosidase
MPSLTQVTFPFILACSTAICGGNRAANYVDPFIGTANSGNTFPGAIRPWGMVSVSPHTDLSAPSGYVHGRPWFYGLGHVHLSGTGCPDLGNVILTATRGEGGTQPDDYRCRLSNERAEAGYWTGTLAEPGIRIEATTTTRVGVTRFTPIERDHFRILLDVGRSLSILGGGAARWLSPQRFEGYSIGGGFCGEVNRHTVFFSGEVDRVPLAHGTWLNGKVSPDTSVFAPDSSVGLWARFDGVQEVPVEARIGISFVSVDNARNNIAAEASGRTFNEIRAEAFDAWDDELSRVDISGGTSEELTKFYTALYHALIHPGVISDASGDYPLFGRRGTGHYENRTRYSVFSLWDTYRTLHPLLSLIYPEKQSGIVNTLVDMYKESGWLPKWELAGNETHMMVGDGAVPVIVDSYFKGIRDFDTLAAYEAMKKQGTLLGPESEPARPGYSDYVKYAYIPFTGDTTNAWWVWGQVSTTLEYCFSDWTFSRFAAAMGKSDDARLFARRSLYYKNLFDEKSGFFRPRKADGNWVSPFDPLATEGSGTWGGSGGPGFVEGNAWQYGWFVPHDLHGLARLYGGYERCAARLDACFAGGNFTINNEPDIAYPYLFTYFPGHESRTADIVEKIMTDDFRTGPAGLPGNDDAGTLSAWYVFSALGFYPACPGSGEYRLGVPRFDHAAIKLDRRYYPFAAVSIRRNETSTEADQPMAITWNGKPVTLYGIDHGVLTAGGELIYTLHRRPRTH